MDWNEWILEKNYNFQEGLEKGQSSEICKIADNGQWSIEKAVRDSVIGSPAAFENPPNVEGAAKEKRYQGGDPRHEETRGDTTKLGNKRSGVSYRHGQPGGWTSGVSSLRDKTAPKDSEYKRDTTVERGTQKRVKWHK